MLKNYSKFYDDWRCSPEVEVNDHLRCYNGNGDLIDVSRNTSFWLDNQLDGEGCCV